MSQTIEVRVPDIGDFADQLLAVRTRYPALVVLIFLGRVTPIEALSVAAVGETFEFFHHAHVELAPG